MDFREIVEEVEEINAIDPATLSERLSKCLEELGEVATEVNKLTGRKVRKSGETDEGIIDNIEEECADLIQCIISLASDAGVDSYYLLDMIEEKNKKWRKVVDKKKRSKRVRTKRRVITKFDSAISLYRQGSHEQAIKEYIHLSPNETRTDAIEYLKNAQ